MCKLYIQSPSRGPVINQQSYINGDHLANVYSGKLIFPCFIYQQTLVLKLFYAFLINFRFFGNLFPIPISRLCSCHVAGDANPGNKWTLIQP